MKQYHLFLLVGVLGLMIFGYIFRFSTPEPSNNEPPGEQNIIIEPQPPVIKAVSSSESPSIQSEQRKLTGRDFVNLGELQSVSGSLLAKHGEWFLETDCALYEIHLGNHEHRAAINIELEAGKKAQVKGFLHEKDIAVVSMIIDEKEYAFRTADGQPLWAGTGRRSSQDSGQGMGRHRSTEN